MINGFAEKVSALRFLIPLIKKNLESFHKHKHQMSTIKNFWRIKKC